jgi:BNR/Asp-box repeat
MLSPQCLALLPTVRLLGVWASEPGAGSHGKSVARSTDGGATWTTESACPIVSSPSFPLCAGTALINGSLGSIDVVSGQQAYLVGPRANLLVTRDGGATWQPVDPPTAGTAGGTSQVIFFNALDGVVLGDDDNNDEMPTIWRTSDGGQQWTPVV